MKIANVRLKKALIDALVLFGLFIFTCISYLFLKPYFSFVRNGIVPQIVFIFLITIVIGVGIFLFYKKKINFIRIIFLLFIISFLIKVCYMINTPFNCRQYDTVTSAMDGHEAYAWIIYSEGHLPTTVDGEGHLMYQFYHPPLNALIQAGFMHIFKPFLELTNAIFGSKVYDTADMNVMFQTSQILATMYMTITSYFGVKLIMSLDFLNNRSKLFGIIFLLFFPRLVQLSGQENNDGICVMLSVIAIYYTYRWWNTKSWSDILIIAFAIGLAMMDKLAAATVALATAFVFIYEFVKDIMSKDSKKIIRICSQFVIFLLICAPIGLWFQIYAMTKYNQPIGYVFGNLNMALYTGDHNFFERFINIFDFKDMTVDLWARAFDNYNIPIYLIKSAIFGEFSYWQGEGFAALAFISNYLFILLSIFLYVMYMIKSKGENHKDKLLGLAILISNLVMDVYFNISMPYGCTMDFRYIVPTLFTGIALIAHQVEKEGIINKIIYNISFVFISICILVPFFF